MASSKFKKSKKGKSTQGSPRGDSIKIPLPGINTPAELEEMVHNAMVQLQEKGAKKLIRATIYLTPADNDGKPIPLYDRSRRRLENITVDEPYRSIADKIGL